LQNPILDAHVSVPQAHALAAGMSEPLAAGFAAVSQAAVAVLDDLLGLQSALLQQNPAVAEAAAAAGGEAAEGIEEADVAGSRKRGRAEEDGAVHHSKVRQLQPRAFPIAQPSDGSSRGRAVRQAVARISA